YKNTFNTQKQSTSFLEQPQATSARYAIKQFSAPDSPLESYFYWFSDNATKQKISAATQFTPNWEDSVLNRNPDYKVSIDFFLLNDERKLLMVIIKIQKLSVFYLYSRFNITYNKIYININVDI